MKLFCKFSFILKLNQLQCCSYVALKRNGLVLCHISLGLGPESHNLLLIGTTFCLQFTPGLEETFKVVSLWNDQLLVFRSNGGGLLFFLGGMQEPMWPAVYLSWYCILPCSSLPLPPSCESWLAFAGNYERVEILLALRILSVYKRQESGHVLSIWGF